MTMQWIIWSLVVLYFVVLTLGVLRVRQQRQARMRLIWPQSTTQHQMEQWGVRFLERLGWEVTSMASQATRTILECTKDGDALFIVFLRDSAFFGRLMLMMGKFGSGVMTRLVIVLYDPPLEAMVRIAGEQKITLVHFRDLETFEDSQSARLPGVMAAREIGRKVQVVQAN